MPFGAVTFDCFGTLVDWKKGVQEFFKTRLGAGDIETGTLWLKWLKRQAGYLQQNFRSYRTIMRDSLKAIHSQVDHKALEEFAESPRSWPLFSDLEHVAGLGVKIGIVSNMDTDLLKATVQRFPFRVDFMVSSEEVVSYKPSPAPMMKAIKMAGTPAAHILHCAFGVEFDIGPAKQAGMKTCLVKRSAVSETGGADYVIAGLGELPAIVRH
jgi:2-haloalkanoic acid dehalogenase type II